MVLAEAISSFSAYVPKGKLFYVFYSTEAVELSYW